jgi:preprotein translocase subunit YajC
MVQFLAQSQGGGSSLVAFLPLILIGVAMYFMLIRPQQRRARQQQALLRSVDVGDEIVTTAGVFGTITDIDEDEDVLTVEIAPGTEVRMLRAGVGRRLTEDDEAYDDDEQDEDQLEPGRDAPDGQQGPIQPL